MLSYLVRRLFRTIPTLFLVSLIAFSILHLAPGDPAQRMLGAQATKEEIETYRNQLNLDKPLHVQYVSWVGGILKGDFGRSIFLGGSVSQILLNRLPVTLSLAVLAISIATIFGILLGVWAASRHGNYGDMVTMAFSYIGISIPEFVIGLVLLFIFAVELRWFPIGGYVSVSEGVIQWLRHLVMPALTLGIIHAALIARMTRANMLEILEKEYVKVARAKGLRERATIWKHAFRNSAISIVTVVGLSFAILLGGAFITEVVFSLPGIGKLVVTAVTKRDYPIVQGAMILIAGGVTLMNLIVDLTYAYLDPRVKYE